MTTMMRTRTRRPLRAPPCGIWGEQLRLAILEDDPDQAEIVGEWLNNAGYRVFCHADAASFLRAVRRESFDLYLIDWLLPDLSGIDVLCKLRNEFDDLTPVIIATVKDEERNIVRALEAGADDYIVKPVRRAELVARVNAILRRVAGSKPVEDSFDAAPYTLDTRKRIAYLKDEEIPLTNREFSLAVFFFRNAGKILSRSHILEVIWGIDNCGVSTRTVDTHVSRLRKKMKLNVDNGWVLSAIYQHGYRVEKVDVADAAIR
jgi:DNA-binding response OmpR family regulator